MAAGLRHRWDWEEDAGAEVRWMAGDMEGGALCCRGDCTVRGDILRTGGSEEVEYGMVV